eukprot:4151789-Ditylum_brightwellii.AAC.1
MGSDWNVTWVDSAATDKFTAVSKNDDGDGIILICCTNDDQNCDLACSILSSRPDLVEERSNSSTGSNLVVFLEHQSSQETLDILTRQVVSSSQQRRKNKQEIIKNDNSTKESSKNNLKHQQKNEKNIKYSIESLCVENVYEEMYDHARSLLQQGKSPSEVQSIM